MSTTDPLEQYDELVMAGEAPDPVAFAARFPEAPDLLARIEALEAIRGDLDDAVGELTRPKPDWPDKIGPYALSAPLGEGGMGAVFRSSLPGGQPCAVKLLSHTSGLALKRFAREAELAQRLDHPGIAKVCDHGVEDGRAYLVTELIEGTTLRQVLGGDPRDIPSLVRLACAVAEALGYAHAQGVVHRDVKPSNIMVTRAGHPRLIDFGLAVGQRRRDERVTRTGVFVGSHSYAAPEQLQGKKSAIGPWTDVYALGATLFEMLAGRPPFVFPTAAGRLAHADDAPPNGPRHYNRDVPRGLDKLVLRALAPKPKKRFKDGAVMAKTLRKWC